ncbi:cytochrome P450 [Biscogniauxia marginata]|nr:cytochrome P450 [Biscogniauxia marginata]
MTMMSVAIPEWWPLSTVATFIVTIITAYAVTYQLSTRKLDPREPTVVASPIPYVGHILGMVLLGGRYVKNIGIRHRHLPIFTLPVPNSRIYIVTDPSLAAAVQRASKALSFTPVIPEATERVLGLDAETMKIVRKNLDPGPGDERSFLADIQDMVYAWLGPGSYLTELTLDAARELQSEVATFAASIDAGTGDSRVAAPPRDLLVWIRHFVTAATAKYLYGPQNPIALDPGLEEAFWNFDHGLGMLLMGMFPSVTAHQAYAGRERLAGAIARYLESGRHEMAGASRIIQERVRIALRHGWTLRAAARSELSFLFAGIVNMTTTTFWIVLQIFADPALLATVREEVGLVLKPADKEDEDEEEHNTIGNDGRSGVRTKYRLNVADLRERCPMLVAVYRECLRLGSDNYSTRVVKEDTLLAGRYFLRKDAVVQIAGGVIHADPSIWGDDAGEFNPGRFLPKNNNSNGNGGDDTGQRPGAVAGAGRQNQGIHPAAFRAFGGGKTLCPGRHFAMSEILSFVALVVLHFDIEGVPPDGGSSSSGKKRIRVPRKNDGVLPVHILEPVTSVMVRIVRRREGPTKGDLLDVRFEM